MRISTNQQYSSIKNQILDAQSRMDLYQRRVSSGVRVERPSDDPFATLGIMALSSARAKTEMHKGTAEAAAAKFSLAESRLGDMSDVMNDAKRIVLQGANGATTQEARMALAREIQSLQDKFLVAANGQDANNHYLFSGYKVTTKPFAPDNSITGNYVLYYGDAGTQNVEVGPGLFLPANMLIDDQVIEAYNTLEDAKQRLEAGDASGLSGITLDRLDKVAEQVRALRGEAGVSIKQFQEAAAMADRRTDELTTQISDRRDADLVETIVELQKAQNAYQASLSAISVVNQVSLLDYIRG